MELKGKIIDFLGDSITEGVGIEDCLDKRYDNVIKEKCGLAEVCNYGIGGTRLAHQTSPSEKPRFDLCFCGRAYNMNPNADIIVVYGGVNDFIHGDAHFGEMTDSTPATFCGAVEFLMNLLDELYPNAKKVFMTPARCYYSDGSVNYEVPSNRPMKKSDAKPLKAYVEVIEKRGAEHNIPVLNLYEKLPVNPKFKEDYDKYTVDGLHFNENGHKLIADLLTDFLKSL